jgi:hypothetical protein
MSRRKAQAVIRQAEALKLRLIGAGYAEIAQQRGYASPEGAWKAVRAGLKRTLQEPADQVRRLEVDRLDSLLAAVWQKAIAGDGEAIDRALRIMKRRAELLGLDAPKNLKMEHGGRVATLDWDSLIRAPQEELRDKISEELARYEHPERNGAATNGHP